MNPPGVDGLPGFRRRIRITPAAGQVCSELEDDYHCMRVTVRHDGTMATDIEAVMQRAPWTTCPGAVEQVRQTFTGIALDAFAARGDKPSNCTHLHDLALLAAAHAADAAALVYDILVSDPVEGRRRVELRLNGRAMLAWTEAGGKIVEPAELAGLTPEQLRPGTAGLVASQKEAIRLLRWGALLAHGRTIPMERQSDASRMPPNCYTFQPAKAVEARRVGVIRDFSAGTAQPLDPPR
ncbi:DUF2889 domain-containing protein [Solimonas sp. K1W22B-7]|uniref:DUF2889 domain-containing protein n=1 Tax=Solimonas sp. K1W22B-7 TaxID=2303331 RepID=UPI000E3310BA|nr:DUF2889 domain-containing protein [Solimonas sp. K1W22B-7]AXQ30666.1 DUF2889 domain-containing protein [Solimonas sp. K1W22B-7]